jgi:C-terminal processing protease CtpA/Prc
MPHSKQTVKHKIIIKKMNKRQTDIIRYYGIFALLLLVSFKGFTQSNSNRIDNIQSFAKVYGYIRYFHPSDEASKMDWNRFVVYGIKKVENCKNSEELKRELNELFKPLAPSVLIFKKNENITFSKQAITPKDTENKELIFWQHQGFGIGDNKDTYKSLRVNRKDSILGTDSLNILFEESINFGETFTEDIGNDLKCIVPMALYGNDDSTFPVADKTLLNKLLQRIEAQQDSLNIKNVYVRLGDIVISWNVFRHFFPYFTETNIDWDSKLKPSLNDAIPYQNEIEFKKTLEKLISKLNDGHGRVQYKKDNTIGFLPLINWAMVEGKLVITGVFDENIKLKPGDIVTKINGEIAEEVLKNNEQYISGATQQHKTYRNLLFTLWGAKNSELKLEINRNDKLISDIKIIRTIPYKFYKKKYEDLNPNFKQINTNVWYLNINKVEMNVIDSLMPQLTKATSIICDLRGYPNGNTDFLRHLITKADTLKELLPPQILFPNQKNVFYKKDTSASFLTPIAPKINAKIIFIVDGRVISWGESYIMFVDHYKLATIVGESTGGTNGVINSFELMGNYSVITTGMKILKGNGKQHHGIGVLPTVPVTKTIKCVAQQKDEFLEKAIELAR